MPIKIDVNITPPPESITKWIDGLIPKLSQFKIPLNKSALLMRHSVQKNFDVGGRTPEGKWTGLRPSTIARKGHSIVLLETGELMGSVMREKATDGEVKVTSATPYGHYHQTGTPNMVARPFMLFQEEDIENITQFFITHIDDKIKYYQERLLKA